MHLVLLAFWAVSCCPSPARGSIEGESRKPGKRSLASASADRSALISAALGALANADAPGGRVGSASSLVASSGAWARALEEYEYEETTCVDYPGWVDDDEGYSCLIWNRACSASDVLTGFEQNVGTDGLALNEACCKCGGGYEVLCDGCTCPAGSYCPDACFETGGVEGVNGGDWFDGQVGCDSYEVNGYCPERGATDYNGQGPANDHCCACGGGAAREIIVPCAAGTYNPDEGSTSIDACRPCSVGTYCPPFSTGEIPCPTGSYCPTGSVEAIPCPEGSFNANEGATSLADCITCSSAGSYCPAGSDGEILCPAGSYCPSVTVPPIQCPIGTFSQEGAVTKTECVPCAPSCPHTDITIRQAVAEWLNNQSTAVTATYGSIEEWDTSGVRSMEMLFSTYNDDFSSVLAQSFNADLSNWDVGNVESMHEMFDEALSFNSDLSKWNTTKVKDASGMFWNANSFDADLSRWQLGAATDFGFMFYGALNFNSDLSAWDVSNVTYMVFTFEAALSFNSELSNWNTAKVKDARSMFAEAASFNSDLSRWQLGAATDISYMFDQVIGFNSDLSTWDVSNVINMNYAFDLATAFNSDLSNWDVSNVISMQGVFFEAIAFNSDISAWNVAKVNDFTRMFAIATSFNIVLCGIAWVTSTATKDKMFKASRGSIGTGCGDVPPGSYCSNEGGACSIVNTCPAGRFCPGGPSNLGEDCPAGEYSTRTDIAAVEDCEGKTCPAGSFCPRGAPAPFPCPAGRYGPFTGVALVRKCDGYCPAGKYSAITGIARVEECENNDCSAGGRYSSISGAGSAEDCENVDCPFDNYCPAGASAPIQCPPDLLCPPLSTRPSECLSGSIWNGTACEPCSPGTYAPFKAATCIPCESGFSVEGSAACTVCAPGTFINDMDAERDPFCDTCPPGSVPSANQSSCTPCEAGTWQSGKDCKACLAGYFGSRTGLFNEKCDGACPPGTQSYRYAVKCNDCEVGKATNTSGSESCKLCDELAGAGFTSPSGASECVCAEGRYLNDAKECVLCTEGMECVGIGNSVANLQLKAGFYRASEDTEEVIECPFPDACDDQAGNNTCRPGNEGVLCAVCSDGYYRPDALSACEQCDTAQAVAWVSLIFSVLGVMAALAVLITINRRTNSGMIRTFISGVQTFSIIMLYNAPYPRLLKDMFKAIGSLNLGIDLIAPQCIDGLGALSYYDSLLFLLIALAALISAFAVSPVRQKYKENQTWAEVARAPSGERAIKDIFVTVLLCYPGLCGMTMEFFRCEDIGGVSYLASDYSLQCYDSKWWGFLSLVLVLIVGFVLGIPLAIFIVLYTRRKALYDPETGRPVKQPLRVLYSPYRPGAYYFESVSMVFKVGLWFSLVYFTSGSIGQLVSALLVNVLQLCTILKIQPMGTEDADALNALQVLISAMLATVALGGLAMKALQTRIKLAELEGETVEKEAYERKIKGAQTFLEVVTITNIALFILYIVIKKVRKLSRYSAADRRAALVRATTFLRNNGGNDRDSPRQGDGQQTGLELGVQSNAGASASALPSPREESRKNTGFDGDYTENPMSGARLSSM